MQGGVGAVVGVGEISAAVPMHVRVISVSFRRMPDQMPTRPSSPAHVTRMVNGARRVPRPSRVAAIFPPVFSLFPRSQPPPPPTPRIPQETMLKPSSPAPEPLHSTTKANVGQENAPSPHTITTKPTMAQSEESSTNSLKLKIPTVRLEGKEISSAMAARLATSLLCHVLFLKSQIPL